MWYDAQFHPINGYLLSGQRATILAEMAEANTIRINDNDMKLAPQRLSLVSTVPMFLNLLDHPTYHNSHLLYID